MNRVPTYIGILGGQLLETPDIELLSIQSNIIRVRLQMSEIMSEHPPLPGNGNLSLLIDSHGGSILPFLSWSGLMAKGHFNETTAYVGNRAGSAAAMIAGFADRIVCLPKTQFCYHFGNAPDGEKAPLNYLPTLISLLEFEKKHIPEPKDAASFRQRVVDHLYTNSDAGQRHLLALETSDAESSQEPLETNDFFRKAGKIVFSGKELAKTGAVEIVDTMIDLKKRLYQECKLPSESPQLTQLNNLFAASFLVQALQAIGKTACVDAVGGVFAPRMLKTD